MLLVSACPDSQTHVSTRVCVYLCRVDNRYVCTYICTYIHTYVRTYVRTYLLTYLLTCIDIDIDTDIEIIYIYIYICTSYLPDNQKSWEGQRRAESCQRLAEVAEGRTLGGSGWGSLN